MRVLAVGIATLDIVNIVPEYPAEDAELRVERQEIRRGGNATNTLVVLRQLGGQCSWAGTLADDAEGCLILSDLTACDIDHQACRLFAVGRSPTSYVTLSRSTGSRTILHHRDIPEYPADDFKRIDTRQFDWIHFEGRNVVETLNMLRFHKRKEPHNLVSLEVEKDRPGIDELLPLPDLLLFSRAFALERGFSNAKDLFDFARPHNHRALLICAWGEQGAWLQEPDGRVIHVAAYPPEQVVDTLGAGDVLNAGMIDGLARGRTPVEALTRAVRLAGRKCGQYGLDALVQSDD